MKLAIISGTTLPGGGPRHIYSLLEKADRKKWDIIICTRKDGSYWDKLIALGITPYDLVLRRLSFFTFFELFKILKKEKPDLIHTHGKGPGVYGRFLGWVLGIPVIHTFHGFLYKLLPVLNKLFYLFVENILTLLTQHHIFVGNGEKEKAKMLRFLNDSNSSVINNGIAQHGGLKVFGATFFVFSDYERPAIRMRALQKLPVITEYTHDSIFVGEDGPTHQPIEHLMASRTIPNLLVLRPCDANEAVVASRIAFEQSEYHSLVLLTRQGLPVLDRNVYPSAEEFKKGASKLGINVGF